NFPGMLWLHLGARSLLGWSSEALRIADVIMIAGSVVLLAAWLPGLSAAARGLVAALLLSFYLSTSEGWHCQRHPSARLPALVGLWLRRAQAARLERVGRAFFPGLLEGIVWGAACWVKPYVIVPAAAAWLWSARDAIARGGRRAWRSVAADALGVLLG